MVISTLLLLYSLIFQYDFLEAASTVESFLATMLETRSHPPVKNIKDESCDYLSVVMAICHILCLTLIES